MSPKVLVSTSYSRRPVSAELLLFTVNCPNFSAIKVTWEQLWRYKREIAMLKLDLLGAISVKTDRPLAPFCYFVPFQMVFKAYSKDVKWEGSVISYRGIREREWS
jgi:hypothetical protein